MRLALAAVAIAVLGLGAVEAARADGDVMAEPADSLVARATTTAVATSTRDEAPRFVRSDRLEVAPSAPGVRGESSELGYRWWVSRGRADLGVGFGMAAMVDRPTGAVPGLGGEGSGRVVASSTVVTLGMRYRTSDRSAVYADAAGLRGPGSIDAGDRPVVGKVGLEFKSAQSRWNVSYGGLGLRLAGDARINVKVRRGGLGLVMHRAF